MFREKETPEETRERLRAEELRNNPSSSVHGSSLADLADGLGWKTSGIILLLLIIGIAVMLLFFR